MTYKKKKRIYKKRKNYSVINKFLNEEKITDKFLLTINSLSLEDLIAIKLEHSAKSSGGNIYGVPLWNSLRDICRDSVLKLAVSVTRTRAEAASFLGISISTLKQYLKEYEVINFFEEKNDEQ